MKKTLFKLITDKKNILDLQTNYLKFSDNYDFWNEISSFLEKPDISKEIIIDISSINYLPSIFISIFIRVFRTYKEFDISILVSKKTYKIFLKLDILDLFKIKCKDTKK